MICPVCNKKIRGANRRKYQGQANRRKYQGQWVHKRHGKGYRKKKKEES